jgi:hypothetical protein
MRWCSKTAFAQPICNKLYTMETFSSILPHGGRLGFETTTKQSMTLRDNFEYEFKRHTFKHYVLWWWDESCGCYCDHNGEPQQTDKFHTDVEGRGSWAFIYPAKVPKWNFETNLDEYCHIPLDREKFLAIALFPNNEVAYSILIIPKCNLSKIILFAIMTKNLGGGCWTCNELQTS